MPGVPNGTTVQVEEPLHAEHHGPELQRTGRYTALLIINVQEEMQICYN